MLHALGRGMCARYVSGLLFAALGMGAFWGCGGSSSSDEALGPEAGGGLAASGQDSASGGFAPSGGGDAPATAGDGNESLGGLGGEGTGGAGNAATGGTGEGAMGGTGNVSAGGSGAGPMGGAGNVSAGGTGGGALGGAGNVSAGGTGGGAMGGTGNASAGGSAGYPTTGGAAGSAGSVAGSAGTGLVSSAGASAGTAGTDVGFGGQGTGGVPPGLGGHGGTPAICGAEVEGWVTCDTPGAVTRYRYVEHSDCCASYGFECSSFCTLSADDGFATASECRATCGGWAPQFCGRPPDPGPCDAALPRYAYNPITDVCEQFVYGGCEGNDNNFETQTECETTCGGGPNPCRIAGISEQCRQEWGSCGRCNTVLLSCDGYCWCYGAEGEEVGIWQCFI